MTEERKHHPRVHERERRSLVRDRRSRRILIRDRRSQRTRTRDRRSRRSLEIDDLEGHIARKRAEAEGSEEIDESSNVYPPAPSSQTQRRGRRKARSSLRLDGRRRYPTHKGSGGEAAAETRRQTSRKRGRRSLTRVAGTPIKTALQGNSAGSKCRRKSLSRRRK